MKYCSDDEVTMRDGRKHRVIYQSGDRLLVKSAEGKSRDAYKISVSQVVDRKPKGK